MERNEKAKCNDKKVFLLGLFSTQKQPFCFHSRSITWVPSLDFALDCCVSCSLCCCFCCRRSCSPIRPANAPAQKQAIAKGKPPWPSQPHPTCVGAEYYDQSRRHPFLSTKRLTAQTVASVTEDLDPRGMPGLEVLGESESAKETEAEAETQRERKQNLWNLWNLDFRIEKLK